MITLNDFNEVFGKVKVTSAVRCWDASTIKEILPPLSESIVSLLNKDLIFMGTGTKMAICTSKKAFEVAKVKRKFLLIDIIRCKQPYMDIETNSLFNWQALNDGDKHGTHRS